MRTNKVLEAAGARWSRKERAHLFGTDDATRLVEQILLTGEITVPQDFGYFPTPPALVARLIELAEIKAWMLVLEPSAGRGAIAREIARIASVECFEILPENVRTLQFDGYARSVSRKIFSARFQQCDMTG